MFSYNSFRMKNKKFINVAPKTNIKKRLGGITDARQKIIQKKRKNVVDARDILAKMAKTQDARNKINKLRQIRSDGGVNGNVQTIGANILRKTDRNGKISLVTNKAKQNQTDMNIAIQQQLGLLPPPPRVKKAASKPSSVATKSVPRNINPPIIRKTILNDLEYSASVPHPPYGYEQPDLYKWYRPDMQPPRVLPPAEPRRQMNHSLVNSSGEWCSYPTASNRL